MVCIIDDVRIRMTEGEKFMVKFEIGKYYDRVCDWGTGCDAGSRIITFKVTDKRDGNIYYEVDGIYGKFHSKLEEWNGSEVFKLSKKVESYEGFRYCSARYLTK